MPLQVEALVIFVLLGTYTPGPGNIMAMNSARHAGLRRSLPFYCGLASAFGTIALLAALFNLALKTILPKIQPWLAALGGLYMIYLALKPFLPQGKKEARSLEAAPFFVGFAVQFLNPKLVLYCIALMSSFIIPWNSTWPVLILVSVLQGLVTFLGFILWGLFGAVFQRVFSQHEKALNVIMALLLFYCAWSILKAGFGL
ncbi:MAG: LysE family transporter [Fretibacterium sp.]|nr:LysE family transporter [Fretibacterium sp.]